MQEKLKIWHFSDSHNYHDLLKIPDNIDIAIFSGDESNYYCQYKNEPECRDFINWFSALKIKYKVMIAGNHSSYIFHNTRKFRKLCEEKNIIYLENETIEIEGIKIFGTPITPTFGNWYFQKSRDKLDKFWKNIPDDTDILVVHGPPKGILDLSEDKNHRLENCGCKALKRHVIERIKPKLMCFGHIHSNKDIQNDGILYQNNIYFSNGSVVKDGKFGTLCSNGNIFEIDNKKNIKIY